ncbi:MAG: hypothetical protein ACRDF7_07580, partial [Candidatus Limnocylindrales bacterium]
AVAGEVLVSDTVRGLTRTGGDIRYIARGRRRLKGITEPMAVYAAVDASMPATGEQGGGLVLQRLGGSGAVRSALSGRGLASVGLLVGAVLVGGLLIRGGGGSQPPGTASPSLSSAASASSLATALPSGGLIRELICPDGPVPAGRDRASIFQGKPELELPDGWTVAATGDRTCDQGYYQIWMSLTERPQSSLILFWVTGLFGDPCGAAAPVPVAPGQDFVTWMRSQPSLTVSNDVRRAFGGFKALQVDFGVVAAKACQYGSPPYVVLLANQFAQGLLSIQIDAGTIARAYALSVPAGVVALVMAPNQAEFDLLAPKADAVLDTLRFPNP